MSGIWTPCFWRTLSKSSMIFPEISSFDISNTAKDKSCTGTLNSDVFLRCWFHRFHEPFFTTARSADPKLKTGGSSTVACICSGSRCSLSWKLARAWFCDFSKFGSDKMSFNLLTRRLAENSSLNASAFSFLKSELHPWASPTPVHCTFREQNKSSATCQSSQTQPYLERASQLESIPFHEFEQVYKARSELWAQAHVLKNEWKE